MGVSHVQWVPPDLSVPHVQASYAPGWHGYEACASYDMERWFRVPTSYDDTLGSLTITHDTPEHDAVGVRVCMCAFECVGERVCVCLYVRTNVSVGVSESVGAYVVGARWPEATYAPCQRYVVLQLAVFEVPPLLSCICRVWPQ